MSEGIIDIETETEIEERPVRQIRHQRRRSNPVKTHLVAASIGAVTAIGVLWYIKHKYQNL